MYYNIKMKASLPSDFEKKVLKLKEAAEKGFEKLKIDHRDGFRFDFPRGWFQIRKSNTEPVYRLIVETDSARLTEVIKKEIISLLK